MTPEAVIIIPHRNDLDRLMRCLSAVMAQMVPGVEVVVVDNGSTIDVAGPVAARFPQVRLVEEPRPGAALARNAGVAATTAGRLIFLDADCLPQPGWLAAALSVDEAEADFVGGAVPVFDESAPRNGAQGFEAVFAFDIAAYARSGFVGSGNMTVTRRVFEAVGGFRPAVSEDKEWCLRAGSKGFRLGYAPDMAAGHPSRADWSALRRKWRRLTDESYALHRTQGRGRLSWALRALAMPASALVHSPRVLTSDRLRGAGERLATLGTLWRLRIVRMGWMLGQVFAPGA